MDFIEEPELVIKQEKDEVLEFGDQNQNEFFQCFICQQTFTNDLDMINHQFLHTNDDLTYDMVL